MTISMRRIAVCLLFAGASLSYGQVVDHGIGVDFKPASTMKEGKAAEFSFHVSDAATGAPLTGARPAAWLSLHHGAAASKDCTRQVATYLAGDLSARADVDLNNYFVLAMNEDASLSVVDPLFGFGGSKLLAMVELEATGEDWALAADQSKLFVSMPAANSVAVIDTRTWNVVRRVATGPHPRRLILRHRLFVADDEGVTAIDAATSSVIRLRIGKTHDLAASDDLVFAATESAIVLIDAHTAKVVATHGIAEGPVKAVAWSSAAMAVYAIAGDHLVAPNGSSIPIRPGAVQIHFAPGGRYALIANPAQNVVEVLDAARNRIVQTAAISDGPDQITFTDLLAYVRRRTSETILTIPLKQLGTEGQPLSVADFPGGQHAYGEGAQSIADSIVPAVDGPSVLLANPADKMIYLYKEGMAAPLGGFSNYGHQPRAALVVDRGLREARPGTYATSVPVTKAGTYDVVFFLDAPRVVACFTMSVEPNDPTPPRPVPRLAAVEPPKSLAIGVPARLRFALTGPGGRAMSRARDVRALALEAPGIWQQRGDAAPLADGTYQFTFIPPGAGTYYLYVESESLGLPRASGQFLVYDAR
jgi:DNA-binding beta-propeller fold protein YncE